MLPEKAPVTWVLAGCLHMSPMALGSWPGAFSDSGPLLSDWGWGRPSHPGEAPRPEHLNKQNELAEGNLIFPIITKLEKKNYNGYQKHITCVWLYLELGDYQGPQSSWQAGWWGAGPPDIGGLGTILSLHKCRAA